MDMKKDHMGYDVEAQGMAPFAGMLGDIDKMLKGMGATCKAAGCYSFGDVEKAKMAESVLKNASMSYGKAYGCTRKGSDLYIKGMDAVSEMNEASEDMAEEREEKAMY